MINLNLNRTKLQVKTGPSKIFYSICYYVTPEIIKCNV